MERDAANDSLFPPSGTQRSRARSFAAVYGALAFCLAAAGFWNAPRLAARAEMQSEPVRTWAASSIETLAPQETKARLGLIHKALSGHADIPAYELPALPTWAARGLPAEGSPSPIRPRAEGPGASQGAAPPPWTERPGVQIIFAGDSLANGYAAGAARALLDERAASRSRDEGKISSGLANSAYFDWPARVRALCKEKPAALVFSLGSNDARDLREGGVFLRFGEPAWEQAYARRSRLMVDIAHSCGARVVWLRMPSMRDPAMASRAKTLDAAQSEACAAADACVAPFEDLGRDMDRVYAERAMVEGKSKLLRAEDGVHMAPEGYRLVARQALRRIGALTQVKEAAPVR